MNTSVSSFIRYFLIITALQGCALDGIENTAPCTAPLTPGFHNCGINHDNENRFYRIYVPISYSDETSMPMVLDIHGAGSPNINGNQLQIIMSDMITQAKEHQFILAWPQAIQGTWNLGSCCGGKDDVDYLLNLVADVQTILNIDNTRIYGTGLSTGAAILQRTACKDASLFAAIAPVSFSLVGGSTWCELNQPLSISYYHSTNDWVVPYNGVDFFNITSAPDNFEAWKTLNECSSMDQLYYENGTSFCKMAASCDDGVEVSFCSLSAPGDLFGGHILYYNPESLYLAEHIWDFFADKQRL